MINSKGLRVCWQLLLQNEDKYYLKFRFISICKPSNFCLLIFQIISSQIQPKCFNVYNQIQTCGIYLDLVSYYYSETIQLQVSYHVLVFSVKELRSLSQGKNVVSSAKLQTSLDSVRYRKALNKYEKSRIRK